MRASFAVVVVLTLTACQTTPDTKSSAAEVQAATQAWVEALNACDPAKLASLYDPEAVFWGTVSQQVISTPAGVRQYFERGCAAPARLQVSLGSPAVRVYENTAINTGAYTFTGVVGGQPRVFPARYSFTYRKREGKWLIVDHHSSSVPAPPVAASAPAQQR
jgi:uncharacterized protein (TIGR02246 family)